jgi:hypothetical protein
MFYQIASFGLVLVCVGFLRVMRHEGQAAAPAPIEA